MKNENTSHGLDFQKKRIKESMLKGNKKIDYLTFNDNELKRVMNKYYDDVIENRIKYEGFLEEKQRLVSVLHHQENNDGFTEDEISPRDNIHMSGYPPYASNSRNIKTNETHFEHHNTAFSPNNRTKFGFNHQNTAKSSSNGDKLNGGYNILDSVVLHKYLSELKEVVYLLVPEIHEKVKSAITIRKRNNSLKSIQSHTKSRVSRFGEKSNALIARNSIRDQFKKLPSGISVPKEAGSRFGHDEDKHSQDSMISKRSNKEIEIEIIFQHFGDDINEIPNLILDDFHSREVIYIEKRFHLLSLYKMVQFKKDILKHYSEKLESAKLEDETKMLQKIAETKNKIKEYEVDLHLKLEKLQLQNNFIHFKTENNVRLYIALK